MEETINPALAGDEITDTSLSVATMLLEDATAHGTLPRITLILSSIDIYVLNEALNHAAFVSAEYGETHTLLLKKLMNRAKGDCDYKMVMESL